MIAVVAEPAAVPTELLVALVGLASAGLVAWINATLGRRGRTKTERDAVLDALADALGDCHDQVGALVLQLRSQRHDERPSE